MPIATIDPLALEAVNIMLRAIREPEVLDIDTTLEYVDVAGRALKVLTRFNRTLQTQGFPCNTDIQTLPIEASGTVPAPADAISLRAVDPYEYFMLQDGKVYDMENRTYTFTVAPEVEVIHLMDFSRMPIEFREYCIELATRQFIMDERSDSIGNTGIQRTGEGVNMSKLAFDRWVIRNAQPNINSSYRQQTLLRRDLLTTGRGLVRYR